VILKRSKATPPIRKTSEPLTEEKEKLLKLLEQSPELLVILKAMASKKQP
jgi:hypothetical protein